MSIFQLVLEAISPELRKLIVNFIHSLSKVPNKTKHPLDVIVVGILIASLSTKDKKGKSK